MPARDPAPEVSEVLEEMPAWAARGLLYTIAAFVIAILVWAHFSVVDVVVTAPGRFAHGKVEATVRNKDIGLIEPGLAAKLKIDAYPFQTYGVIPARVAGVEPSGGDYQVVLDPARTTVEVRGQSRPLLDGLALTAEIVTDRQTMLSLLLRPFQKPAGARGGRR